MKLMLDVQHIWQLDPDSNVPENLRSKVCAPVSANMVLDYVFRELDRTFELAKIIDLMQRFGGRSDTLAELGDWKHSAEVETLKNYGLTAWRRNWLAPSQDPAYFIDHENYNQKQVQTYLEQRDLEPNSNNKEKMLYSVLRSLEQDCPVIVSVRPGFSEQGSNHQLVICGYDDDSADAMLCILDPLVATDHMPSWVSLDFFWQYSKLQAIFVRPTV